MNTQTRHLTKMYYKVLFLIDLTKPIRLKYHENIEGKEFEI